jgi:hypothetical protein
LRVVGGCIGTCFMHSKMKVLDELSTFMREYEQETVIMMPEPAFKGWYKTNYGYDSDEACYLQRRVICSHTLVVADRAV